MKSDRLQALLAKKAKLAARIQKLSAHEQADARRRDTRKKIIAGALVLALVEKNPKVAEWWATQVVARIERPQDRALFEDQG